MHTFLFTGMNSEQINEWGEHVLKKIPYKAEESSWKELNTKYILHSVYRGSNTHKKT